MLLKFTQFHQFLVLVLLLVSSGISAQTATSFSPTVITHRTPITITGTGFTTTYVNTPANVKFNGIAAESLTFITATQIRAIVPSTATSGNLTVVGTAGTITVGAYTYIAPAATPATAGITRIITNYNNAWVSTTTANNSVQPDLGHSVMGFTYIFGTPTTYSTGNESAITGVLTTAGLSSGNGTAANTYAEGNWRALPINNIQGNVTGTSNLIVLASRIDGSANTQVPTAPSVAGLSARDVLIDGIRGLNIGTGVTNLPSTSILTFQTGSILANNDPTDAIPDIMVSQIADPSDDTFSIYCFVDNNGNIVGNPVRIALNGIAALGTYKTDFFTLPQNQSLNTAVVNGSILIGGNTRPIRMVAYRLADFGITAANKNNVSQLKLMPSGTSDPAFMAYNRTSFAIPAPEITTQPVSQAVCPGGTASFTITVSTQGTELTYQWEKNGVALVDGGNVSGATTATLTINPVGASDAAVYRCLVTNPNGAAFSNSANLNTVILSATGGGACLNSATASSFVEVGAQGTNLVYQWYSNGTTNSNIGGTIISGATSITYFPPVNQTGTRYYYAEVLNSGFDCTRAKSNPVAFVVTPVATTGTAPANRTVCNNNATTLTLIASSGNIQWQQSATANGTYANVSGGTGGTTASYTTPNLTATTYYRAVATSTNGSCTQTSSVITVTVISVNVWEGDVSADWNTAGNWACGIVPTLLTDATIPVVTLPNVYPVITGLTGGGVANVKNITIASGAGITINNAGIGNFRIAGTVTNNGTLNALDGTVTFMGTTGAQAIPANVFFNNYIRNLTIDNTAGVALAGTLNLTGILNPKAGTFTTGNALTLKSNALTTAMIAPVTGAVSGTMTIERYLPARRAFRLLSSPVDGESIFANWQEGDPVGNIPGFGTDITGAGGTASGFDVSGSNNPSLFSFDNTTGTWNAVTSTIATNLIAGKPLRMLVRGDRTIDQTLNVSPPTVTTLRSTGTIKTGTIVVNGLREQANALSFVGNPYQAPVNMATVLNTAVNVNPNFYNVWDPTMGGAPVVGSSGGRGAYVTVLLPQGTNSVGSVAGKYLQPNHAVFVETMANGPASLTFNESDKDLLTNLTPSLYRTGNDGVGKISLQLYDSNSLSLNDTPADGTVVEFGTGFNNGVDAFDARKMVNQDENLAFTNDSINLSVARRAFPLDTEVLPLYNSTYRKTNYTYTVQVENLDNATALLMDKFAGTTTQLANNSETVYNFSVDPANELSIAANRFDIVFSVATAGVKNADLNTLVSLYPNPSQGSGFSISIPQADGATVSIYNTLGQKIEAETTVQNGSNLSVRPMTAMAAGVYTVQVTIQGKTAVKKLIVK